MIKEFPHRLKDRLQKEIDVLAAPKALPAVFAIDLSQHSVKIVRAERTEGKFNLEECQSVTIAPPGDDEHITQALGQAIAKLKIKPREVHLSLSSDEVMLRHITLPDMPAGELKEAVAWQAKTKLGADLESSAWDYFVAEERTEADQSRKLDIIFVTVPRDRINRLVNILKSLNLTPTGITAAPLCLDKLTTLAGEVKPDEVIAVADIGYQHTNIIVTRAGKLKFIRQMSTAGDSITKAMTGALVSDYGRVELSMKDAEQIKHLYGLPDAEKEGLIAGKIPPTQLAAMVKLVLEHLSSEIKRSFDYYRDELGGEEIDRVILSGGGSKLKNFKAFLSKQLDVEVQELPEQFDASFGVGIGLALGEAQKINLLPPEVKNRRFYLIEKMTLRLATLSLVAILLISSLLLGARENSLKMMVESKQKNLSAALALVELKEDLLHHQALISSLRVRGKLVPETMKALSVSIPLRVVFKEVLYQQDGKIKITGEITGPEISRHQTILAEYLAKLNKLEIFGNTELVSCRVKETFQEPSSDFELRAEIAY